MSKQNYKIADILEDEEKTLMFLAQHGDEESTLRLIDQYSNVIRAAAMQNADRYGYEDCMAEARCAFIERINAIDAVDTRRFRTALRQELSDAVVSGLNPHGLSRRQISNVDNLPTYVHYNDAMLNEFEEHSDVRDLSSHTKEVMAAVLNDQEMTAVTKWLESPNMTDEEIAEDLGMSRRSFKRQLSVAFAKLRENL